MNKAEIKDKWLKELRSGKHKQVKGTLVEQLPDGTLGYCCLGVLVCKVLGEDIQPEVRIELPDDDYDIFEGSASVYARINKILGETWEIPADGHFPNRDIFRADANSHLTTQNDDYDQSFAQIADQIEKYWKV